MIKQLQEKRLVGERWSLTKIDMHLTWELSDDIVICLYSKVVKMV